MFDKIVGTFVALLLVFYVAKCETDPDKAGNVVPKDAIGTVTGFTDTMIPCTVIPNPAYPDSTQLTNTRTVAIFRDYEVALCGKQAENVGDVIVWSFPSNHAVFMNSVTRFIHNQ